MPPKKPRNSKKKTNKKNKGRSSNAAASSNVPSNRRGDANALSNIAAIPTFHSPQHNSFEGGGYYETYKASTTRFWEWMKQACPNSKITGVNDLRRGASKLLNGNIAILDQEILAKDSHSICEDHTPTPIVAPAHIMSDLSTSIEYREKFTSFTFGEGQGDEGHRYMIEVLRYCRSVLNFGRNVAKVAVRQHVRNSELMDASLDEVGGRFHTLLLDEDDEEKEEDMEAIEKEIRERNIPTYNGPEHEEEIDIESVLINGDDRFQAVGLLNSMDQLMGVVNHHYELLKECMNGKSRGHQSSSTLQLMMECAAVANLATESVLVAESALAAKYPHLSSFYNVLAIVFLPQLIANVETQIYSSKLGSDAHGAVNFVGSILECSFHNRGHGLTHARVREYSKSLGIPFEKLNHNADIIRRITDLECMTAKEEALNHAMLSQLASDGARSHIWLSQSNFIGNDRCIINTQVIVQKLMSTLTDNAKLVGKPGFWGYHFDDTFSQVRRIRGDLDEPFASAIMPELIEICRRAPFDRLPETRRLITVLDLLQKHVKGDRTAPIPASLTFGLHAILTSIFVLQGNGDLVRLASHAKTSYNELFAQLDNISDPSSAPQNAPNFYSNVGIFKNLVNFAKPVVAKSTAYIPQHDVVNPAYAERLAFWNPLIGGEYMLYATYICSIGLGSATVDSMGQLRFVLHLYNALKQRDSTFEIPLLQDLDVTFAKTKAVWVGGRPSKGSYCKHFWMAWGMSISNASRMASEHSSDDQVLSPRAVTNTPDLRDLDEILPEEFSKSYARIVQQDYADEEGQALYTVKNAKDTQKRELRQQNAFINTLSRINATRDAMDDDENRVMPVNFSKVGCILLKLVNELAEKMGWTELVNQFLVSFPEVRSGRTMGGSRMRGFTSSDLNLRHHGISHYWAHLLARLDSTSTDAPTGGMFDIDKVGALMVKYFDSNPRESYTFFVQKEIKAPKNPNPLEASYPYGMTGRTPRDPLRSILHFKRSKRGKPTARMVTPGKLSNQESDAKPYDGPSQLTGGPSGKFRHIASYSLEELIDLGWDGSFYCSRNARHAATNHYVPFIPGYDSDSADEYEPIDVERGSRAGTIDLAPNQIGLYMTVPSRNRMDEVQLVQIQDPNKRR